MPGSGDIAFRLQYGLDDPNEERWPIVPLSVGQDLILEMLPNLLAPRSSIGRNALADLRRRSLLPPTSEAPFALRDLRIPGQPVPDVEVRVGPAARFLQVDGVLGFDFFAKFSKIILEVDTRWLTLVGR